MGLSRFAAPRPLVVQAADGTRDRLAAEGALRSRGWRPALSPGETGMLVVCGNPGPALAGAIDVVWRDMPEPRVLASPSDLEGVAGGSREALDLDAGMADRADDRDGLRLDVLHVPLGPVLPFWPAGLRVDLVLQGTSSRPPRPPPSTRAAGRSGRRSGRRPGASTACRGCCASRDGRRPPNARPSCGTRR
ncbi:hypothetical protein [Actinomadura madurae]|uniref:hypothetical protein n=1 Tax=Actinomadura madurae TaxID=1993 RepID=UPI0020D25700|nr:hypothetical protein [Actinomadura madurae]MCQ0019794.1 hypothetical protein [Actinomadura madurae]